MKRYDERVLGKLLDIYERSLLYSGKNKINRTISMAVSQKTLPEYFDESNLQFDAIHQQLEQLEAEGFIRLVWKNRKKGHILEKCELNMERTEDAYRRLRRKPRKQKEEEIVRICGRYRGKDRNLDGFLDWVQSRIEEGASIRRYVDEEEPEAFDRLCRLILQILSNQEECFLRQFSIRLFHDSKTAEKDISRAARVLAEFSLEGRLSDLQEEEILEEYNIYRNPSWLMMKGKGRFRRQTEAGVCDVDLTAFSGGIGLSNRDAGSVCWDPGSRPDAVVTVENLTSFHQWEAGERRELGIYLGGYHNYVKRMFLEKLYQAYPGAEYRHFGDIDCGGFRIWKDLCVKTGIPFQTLHMDLETYERYRHFGRQLTEQDRKTLASMMEDPFFEGQRGLFHRMLQLGVKLEQECIPY